MVWIVSPRPQLDCDTSGRAVADPEGFHSNPSPSPIFKNPMKMEEFGLNEANFINLVSMGFHFHGIFNKFKKNEIKLAKRTTFTLYIWTPFQKSWICPCIYCLSLPFILCVSEKLLAHMQCASISRIYLVRLVYIGPQELGSSALIPPLPTLARSISWCARSTLM